MLRIISGEFRRRLLETPPDAITTRPIPDRVKGSLFQILRGHCQGATVIDTFAGVGPIGLEALSRGASKVVMVERDRRVFQLLERNAQQLGPAAMDRLELVCGDALGPGALARCPRPVHLVFMDPPFPMIREPIGFARIKAQFERLISLLDDTGYAVLRTPSPLVHEFDAEGQPIVRGEVGVKERAPRPVRDEYNKKKSRRDEDDEPDGRWLREDEIADMLESPAGQAEPAAPKGPVVARREFPSLEMAGAVGPETHDYHNMALHLYMKKGPTAP